MDFVDQSGVDFTSQAAGGVDVQGISRRGDDGVWWVMAKQPPLAGVEAGHEGEDVESAAYPISLVGGCLQPDVAHTLDLFLCNDLCHLGITCAHM